MSKFVFRWRLFSSFLFFLIFSAIFTIFFFVGLNRWQILVLISFWLASLIFNLSILIEKRDAETKTSWLVAFSIIPFFSQLLFLVLGQGYFRRLKYRAWLKNQSGYYNNVKRVVFKDVAHLVSSKTTFNTLENNALMVNQSLSLADITVYDNGNDFFNKLFLDMREAKRFIHIDIYIINPGELWDECKSILIEKRKQGVEVRILIDHFGTILLRKKELNELKSLGIKIVKVSKLSFALNSEILYRNHRKCFIIDGKIAYTGGLNIADEYVNLSKLYGTWLDVSIRIDGEYVSKLASSFNRFWHSQTKEFLDSKIYSPSIKSQADNALIHLIETGPDSEEKFLMLSLMSLIGQTKKELQLATPYFIPTNALVQTLKAALLRGVKIKIYFSGHYDWKIVWLSSLQHLFELEKFGLEIFFVRNCWVHSKIAIFDREIAYVGTMNLDYRSFFLQYEIASFFVGQPVERLKEIINKYHKWSISKDHKEYKKIRRNGQLSIFKIWLLSILKPYF